MMASTVYETEISFGDQMKMSPSENFSRHALRVVSNTAWSPAKHMGILSICLNAYALRRVFKWVIYVARKILSREMKDYNKFTHISNTVDMHFVCRDFGWGYINDQSANITR